MQPRPVRRPPPARPAPAPAPVPSIDDDGLRLDQDEPATARVTALSQSTSTVSSITTTNNGAQLEQQLDGLMKSTTLDDLAKKSTSRHVKTMKESQLRELIRQAVNAVISSSSSGADEATLDRIQSELKRSMADSARAAAEREALEQRLREAESARDAHSAELESAKRQAAHQRLRADEAEAENARLRTLATIDSALKAEPSEPAYPDVRGELSAAHEECARLRREMAAHAQEIDEDFITAQRDLAQRDRELSAANARALEQDERLARANGTIARLEAELAERLKPRPEAAPAGPLGGAFLAAPGRPRALWRSAPGKAVLAAKDGGMWRQTEVEVPGSGEVTGWHRDADASDRMLSVDAASQITEVSRGAAGRLSSTVVTAHAAPGDRPSGAEVPGHDIAGVATRDAAGRIHLSRLHQGRWVAVDLSQVANAPRAGGAPTCWFWARENSWHIVYPDGDGVLHELFELSGRWYHSRLAASLNIPLCAGGLIAHAPGQSERVLYCGRDGHLHALTYDGAWSHRDLAVADARSPSVTELPSGQIVAWRSFDGTVHAVVERSGHFQTDNVCLLLGAPKAAHDPQLVRDGNAALLIYPAADGRIIQAQWNGAWSM